MLFLQLRSELWKLFGKKRTYIGFGMIVFTRLILARPVSRFRLLVTKWLAGAVFAALLVFVLALCGIVVAQPWFRWGGLFVFVPGEVFGVFDPFTGIQRYAAAHLLLITKAVS